jgi:hypothetical protein
LVLVVEERRFLSSLCGLAPSLSCRHSVVGWRTERRFVKGVATSGGRLAEF